MFSYQPQIFENNQWQALSPWARPFTDGTALNDILDAGCINLSLSSRYNPIKPFTPIRIIIAENGVEVDRIYRFVSSTKRTRRTFAPSVGAKYDWTINTIEITKAMERRFIGTLTSTKYLHTDYNEKYAAALVSKETDYPGGGVDLNVVLVEKNKIMQPYQHGDSIDIPCVQYYPELDEQGLYVFDSDSHYGRVFRFGVYPCTVTIDVDGRVIYTKSHSSARFDTETLTIPNEGERLTITYETQYESAIIGTTNYESNTLKIEYKVSLFTQIVPKTQPTITSVCQRLLSSGITRRVGIDTSAEIQKQEYVLDENFAQEYKNITAPEFSFTNCTLWDALSQVGGYIHAIPRLVPLSTTDDTHYKVTFDKLGGSEQAPAMPPMIYQDSTIDSNEWCGKITSPAQNLCNTTDEGGAITEFGNDYITVRTEDGNIEINGDNVLIRTSLPIQQLIKLECGFIPEYNSGNTPVGDITAYAYEDAEYSVLSSYWGTAYPYSKAWALRWKQGGNIIDGLTFKQEGQTSVSEAFNNTAIVNIINAKTGIGLKPIDTSNGEWYRRLAFKVTYVPIATARVEAVKPVLTDGGETSNALVYNQGANVAETSFYGEKMRGAIARLGQDVEQRTYDIKTYSQMPKVGQILDGKYIATVDAEYDITRIRITVTLAKNFNQLSQFVGLNSNYRLYDISEKQSVERHIHYAERIIVGKSAYASRYSYQSNGNTVVDTHNTILRYFTLMMKRTFDRGAWSADESDYVINKIMCAFVSFDKFNASDGVLMPVVAFPFGNSICFNISFYDNYGAGFQSSNDFENEKNKATQRLVPYTDVYGEFSKMSLFMSDNAWTPSFNEQKDGGKAMLYPEGTLFSKYGFTTLEATGNLDDYALKIDKDSREQIDVSYQVHYVSDSDDIIVCPGLASFNPYVSKEEAILEPDKFYVIWQKQTINALNKDIVTSSSITVQELSADTAWEENTTPLTHVLMVNGILKWNSMTCPINGAKSWAICKKVGTDRYTILFGQNVDRNSGETTDAIYFSAVIPEDYQEVDF
jgi:hypothetical protein